MKLTTVKVPPALEPLFLEAEKYVANYFNNRNEDPNTGVIEINGERYILLRASSMSVDFLEFLKKMYPAISEPEAVDAASIVLYDIAKSMGSSNAAAFHAATGVTDPIAKLSTGPIHFAYTGWAFVDIFEESHPSSDENYFLIYDHPNSFEADSWLKLGNKTNFCTCFMNAGYSAGWCQKSFNIPLEATEILCRSKGDPYCRFIMAQPHRISEFIREYRSKHPELFNQKKGP